MKSDFGLPRETLLYIKRYISVFPEIYEVRVYGSRAMGNYHKGSDIDLAIYGDKIDYAFVSKLKGGLEALPVPYQFDVTHYNSLQHEGLKKHIDECSKLLFRRSFCTRLKMLF